MVRLPGDNSEPGKLRAALFALLVHAAFLALLVFGLNWKNEVSETMSVDLWAELPRRPVEPPSSAAKVIPEPVKVKPQPQQKTQPQPQPVIKAAPPPVRKPDIALKDKTEKPQLKEEVKKPEPVKKEVPKKEPTKKPVEKPVPKEEVKKPEPVKKVEQKTEKKEDVRQQAEAQKQAQQREREVAAANAERARADGEIEKYREMIKAKIRSRIIMPPDLPGNPAVEFTVTLLPGGDVLTVTLRKSSGYTAFDEAVERAIYLAKPLPLPPDPGLFNAFRNLDLKVYYRE
ncbi:MAG: TonB family protein [Nitrosomonas sp. PRO5]|nr:TonB family protein [Nitrosomonas sp. PRO5]